VAEPFFAVLALLGQASLLRTHEIAKVLRDMHRLKFDKELSFGERRLLERRQQLARALAQVAGRYACSVSLAGSLTFCVCAGRLLPA